MTIIWKHVLPEVYGKSFRCDFPKGAEILSCQLQHGKIVLWEKHDMQEKLEQESRYFFIHFMPSVNNRSRFLGTVQLEDGQLILHVFELAL